MKAYILIWLVPIAIALHNLEEGIWLPAARARLKLGARLGPPDAFSFRFAVAVLTALAFLIALLACLGGPASWGFYLLGAYALGQGLNVFVPHLAGSLLTRSYLPGLGTGLLFVLPASAAFLVYCFSAPGFNPQRFLLTSAVFVPALLVAIPFLFRLGGLLRKL